MFVRPPSQTVVIVGGGLSGLVCALQVRMLCPGVRLIVVERSLRRGPGLAYGEFAGGHVLNVPAKRLEIGSDIPFHQWLAANAASYDLDEALAEAGGKIEDVFAPRAAFGDFLEETARRHSAGGVFDWIQGEASGFLPFPRRGVVLTDGAEIEAAAVILATGNESPGPIGITEMESAPQFLANPWASGALDRIGHNEPVVLVGAGLTAVDVTLALRRSGHTAGVTLVSRRGLLPRRHKLCPPAAPFIQSRKSGSPADLIHLVRRQSATAMDTGAPWQGVIDAMRPITQDIWHGWRHEERRSFLRHLRAWWDVHRHRMAPRVADQVDRLQSEGYLRIISGRITGARNEGDLLDLDVSSRGQPMHLHARHVINCTGPTTDVSLRASPIVADGLARGFIRRDGLGLGIETSACAAIAADSVASDWLFAIGPLTRPEFWEVTAVPEIRAQGRALAERLSAADTTRGYGI
jgi:uncharacterized NAD(P)/FAD-binding protein YdhS